MSGIEIERKQSAIFLRWRGLTRAIWFGRWGRGRTLKIGDGILLVACCGRGLLLAPGPCRSRRCNT